MVKVLKVLGYIAIAVILLFITVVTWSHYSLNSAKEDSLPFVEMSMPVVSTWNIDTFEHLLHPDAKPIFAEEKTHKMFNLISRLGELISFEPELVNVTDSATTSGGIQSTHVYQIKAIYSAENALVTMTLLKVDGIYLISRLSFDSDIFLEPLSE